MEMAGHGMTRRSTTYLSQCARGRGTIKNTFPNYSIVLMEWFSSSHFQGGYKLQILDHLERPSFDLTPTIAGSDFVKSDAT